MQCESPRFRPKGLLSDVNRRTAIERRIRLPPCQPHLTRVAEQAEKSPVSASCGSVWCALIPIWRLRLSARRSPSPLLQACAESECIQSPLGSLRRERTPESQQSAKDWEERHRLKESRHVQSGSA